MAKKEVKKEVKKAVPAKKEVKKAAPAKKPAPAVKKAAPAEKAPEQIYPTCPDIKHMKPEAVKAMLVDAAIDMNKTLGLKPPINVKGDLDAIKQEIIDNAVDVVEEDELFQSTWLALAAIGAKLGFDTSELDAAADKGTAFDPNANDGVVGDDTDDDDDDDEDDESSDDTDEDEEDEDEDED